VVIHSENNGHFDRLSIGPAWKVKSRHLFAAPGDAVTAYTGSHCSLGLLITAFPNAPTMLAHMDRLRDHVRVHLQPPPTRQDRRMLQDEFALGNVSNVGNVGTLALGSSQLALLSGL
jgi:hypothetical protein